MEPDKEHIHYCFLFCFHQKKNATDAYKIICETYDKNVIAIKMYVNWFKFKNDNFDISDKKRFRRPVGKKKNYEKIGKNGN